MIRSLRGRGAAFGFAVVGLLLSASSAFAGAWPVTHKWSDKARPNDPTSGSFAYEYGRESIAAASSMTKAGVAYDCADFAITVLVEYAAKNGLEVVWTMPDPAKNGAVGQVSSTEARFHSPAQFANWSRGWINAKMVATMNTSPISYSDWRAGDVVMMRWNQLGDENPFPGRDVWHTYFTGDPEKLLLYGNIDGEEGPNPTPLAIVATADSYRLQEIHGPAVYGGSPRRWNVLKDSVIPPSKPLQDVPAVLAPKDAQVNASSLNVRDLPGVHSKIIGVLHKGDKVTFEGRTSDGWSRIRRADGSIAYVSSQYVTIVDGKLAFPVEGLETAFTPPSTTSGLNGALGINGNP